MVQNASVYYALGGALATYLFATFFIFPYFSAKARWVRSQPWIGDDGGLFSKFRSGYKAIFNTADMVRAGYEKYSMNHEIFVIGQFARDPLVIVPRDSVHDFLSRSDEAVDHQTIGKESIFHKYAFGTDFDGEEHFTVVRRQLTRKLPTLTADVYNELTLGMEDQWKLKPGSEWTPVNIYPTTMKIVSRAANRVFAGKDLCRDPDFLEHSRLYAMSVFKCGALTKLIPSFLHPLVAPLAMRDINKHLAVCMKIASPVIGDRLKRMQSEGKAYEPANDVLQWILDDALESGDPRRLRLDYLCRLLLLLNMVAIHTTSMVTTNTLLDLGSSPRREEFLESLREESARMLGQYGEWNKDAVNDLLRVDSAIREAMRFSDLGALGMPRIIKEPNGITLKNGTHIPQGVRVAMPARGIHLDPTYYPNPLEYDALRFSAPREAFNATEQAKLSGDQGRLDKVLELKNRGLIVTTDDFLSFGAQRHACPGRFFASQEMKLLLAHLVLNYDIKTDGPRPQNFAIDGASVPTDDAILLMRPRVQ